MDGLLEDEGGTTAVEYAVMIALITAVCVGAVQFMAAETIESFERSGEAIQQATSN